MHFDRFDICEAWYLHLVHNHAGQWSPEYERLCHLREWFIPRELGYERLTDNGQAIYDQLQAPGP
jgi:hypothetical protein